MSYDYDEFGNVIDNTASNNARAPGLVETPDYPDESYPIDNPYRYAGYEYIEEVNLYDLNARYYNPEIARFLSADPYYNLGNRVIGLYEINVPNVWSIIQSNALYTYCGNSPISCYDISGCKLNWRFWESWIITKDDTRKMAREIIANPAAVYITQNGLFSWVFNAFGFFRDDKGVYHTYQNAWQQIGGYNVLYDVVFDYATSMKSEKFTFSVGDRDFVLWAWKGDYLNLGAGAELGIYSNKSGIAGKIDVESPHDGIWLVDTNLAMKMTLTLKDKNGDVLIEYKPSEKQWWITGFNPYKQNVNANDLVAVYTVTFTDQDMYQSFYSKYGEGDNQDTRWSFDSTTYTATFSF